MGKEIGNGILSGEVQCYQSHQSKESNFFIILPERPDSPDGRLHTVSGVELQSNLSWNRHMDQAVKKANSTLGFLRRKLRVSNEQTKSSAYFSMVRPIVEYCSTVWNPYTIEYIKKVEMVQPDMSPTAITTPAA